MQAVWMQVSKLAVIFLSEQKHVALYGAQLLSAVTCWTTRLVSSRVDRMSLAFRYRIDAMSSTLRESLIFGWTEVACLKSPILRIQVPVAHTGGKAQGGQQRYNDDRELHREDAPMRGLVLMSRSRTGQCLRVLSSSRRLERLLQRSQCTPTENAEKGTKTALFKEPSAESFDIGRVSCKQANEPKESQSPVSRHL